MNTILSKKISHVKNDTRVFVNKVNQNYNWLSIKILRHYVLYLFNNDSKKKLNSIKYCCTALSKMLFKKIASSSSL